MTSPPYSPLECSPTPGNPVVKVIRRSDWQTVEVNSPNKLIIDIPATALEPRIVLRNICDQGPRLSHGRYVIQRTKNISFSSVLEALFQAPHADSFIVSPNPELYCRDHVSSSSCTITSPQWILESLCMRTFVPFEQEISFRCALDRFDAAGLKDRILSVTMPSNLAPNPFGASPLFERNTAYAWSRGTIRTANLDTDYYPEWTIMLRDPSDTVDSAANYGLLNNSLEIFA